jgi:STE24 endopeptidase
MNAFTWAFLAALAAATAVRLWLASRHIRHIASHRAKVPEAFAEQISLASHQKAADYTSAKTRLGMLEVVLGAALVLAFTLGGGLEAMSVAWAGAAEPGGLWHGVALVVSLVLATSALDLPFAWYRTFVVEARFGFNRMTPALFLGDLAKQSAIAAVLGIPLLALVLWLMQRMGQYWWLYVWATWVVFNLLVLTFYPTYIAPLFNKFSPLQDESLKERIERLLARCGFQSQGLFVMDSSKRSSHGNAYFSGLGAAKRIVLFDTLIARLAPQEIEAVLAHELGHFSHRHVAKRIVLLFAMSLAFLALLGWLITQDWFYSGLGVRTPSTAAALVLFFLAAPAFTFLLNPLTSLYSRKHEYEADAYAAQQADGADLVRALVKLYQDNASTLTPDPLHSAFYDSHPPAALRIERLKARAAA